MSNRMKERELTESYPRGKGIRMICPHCHSKVPHGAAVCVGCKAEIRYGNTGLAAFIAFIAAMVAGFAAQWLLPRSLGLVSILMFSAVFVWLFILLRRWFANDVRFNRRYRH